MKKYGKKTIKTFQIRLTDVENEFVLEAIKKTGKTRREFILGIIDDYLNY